MKLDSRILEGKKPLTCFDTEEAKRFIGKECYLSDEVASFANIDNLNKATLKGVDDGHMRPYKLETTRGHYGAWSPFILPCEWIKPEESEEPEKKYRAFTLNEFVNQYSLGDEVIMRIKDDPTSKHVLFVGYEEGGDDVLLGQYWNTFMILFNNYELYIDGKWQPFGVIDEDKE